MNIHEYQAKKLFEEYDILVPKGYTACNESEIDNAISILDNGQPIVVKSQIHAGGRGKGTFKDGFKGGVKVSDSMKEAKENAMRMLNNFLITKQTGSEGRKVQTIYLTEACEIEHEYYLAVLLNRELAKVSIVASLNGGMDIEKVAEETPDAIIKESFYPDEKISDQAIDKISLKMNFNESLKQQFSHIIKKLILILLEKNAELIEINPLVKNNFNELVALDAKVSFDNNALFKHPEIEALRDLNEEDPKEIEASKYNLNYIALNGSIACMVNGAGLAMATMDIIKSYGGEPANFLDVGGSANEEQVTAAFKIILSDRNVKGILVNIFGGIMKCDVIARGIVSAAKTVNINVPLIVRLEGTNVDLGKEILKKSNIKIFTADSLADAADIVTKKV